MQRDKIDHLKKMLAPRGKVFFTVSTASDRKRGVKEILAGEQSLEEFGRKNLTSDWNDKVLLLGIPSDTGGNSTGYQLGATRSPENNSTHRRNQIPSSTWEIFELIPIFSMMIFSTRIPSTDAVNFSTVMLASNSPFLLCPWQKS